MRWANIKNVEKSRIYFLREQNTVNEGGGGGGVIDSLSKQKKAEGFGLASHLAILRQRKKKKIFEP